MPRKSVKKNQSRRRTLEFSVRYSPRINRRFLRMLSRICAANHMPESDVLRYGFEAALLEEVASAFARAATAGSVHSRRLRRRRRETDTKLALDSMVTVRTTAFMARKLELLFRANRDEMQADVLRGLLERILPIARDKGMAHVMRMREANLGK